jgi:FkbM family methyltransferase
MGAITLRSLVPYSPLHDLARAASVTRMPPPLRRTRRVFGIRTTVARFDGSVYYVPDYAAHRPVARNILNKRYVSPGLHQLVARVMTRRPGSMISAGTFFGDMLPSFSHKTPGLVYAFEPVIENYLLARAIVDDNSLGNVVLLHAGLGAEAGMADIGTSRKGKPHLGGAARVISGAQKAEFISQRAPLLAIDQLAINDLSMIQLDIEGYELRALQGAICSIQAQQPVIVIEDNARNCSAFLADLDYAEVTRIGRDHVYVPESAAAALADLLPGLELART